MDKRSNGAWIAGGIALGALLLANKLFGADTVEPYPMPVDPGTGQPMRPTLTDSQVRLLVDRIFGAIYGDGSFWSGSTAEDEQAVVDALAVPQNDADVVALINAWGVRSGRWSTAGDLTLPATVREYLGASDIATINAGFRARGISYTF
jgi:hypothetical protein